MHGSHGLDRLKRSFMQPDMMFDYEKRSPMEYELYNTIYGDM